MKKISLKFDDLTLSRETMKQIGGGGVPYYANVCGQSPGATRFYAGSDGCGYQRLDYIGKNGECVWRTFITASQPCGWA